MKLRIGGDINEHTIRLLKRTFENENNLDSEAFNISTISYANNYTNGDKYVEIVWKIEQEVEA